MIKRGILDGHKRRESVSYSREGTERCSSDNADAHSVFVRETGAYVLLA